jgi:hypothetical protein
MADTQVADRQATLSAGRVVLKLSSADAGSVTLDKVEIHVEEMEKLLGFRQGQLVICFHNGIGEQIAEIHSEQWTLTIKPKTVRMSFDLRIRPEAETLLMLREIQQNIEGEDDEGATVVLRPLQSAELMEDEDGDEDVDDDVIAGENDEE